MCAIAHYCLIPSAASKTSRPLNTSAYLAMVQVPSAKPGNLWVIKLLLSVLTYTGSYFRLARIGRTIAP